MLNYMKNAQNYTFQKHISQISITHNAIVMPTGLSSCFLLSYVDLLNTLLCDYLCHHGILYVIMSYYPKSAFFNDKLA